MLPNRAWIPLPLRRAIFGTLVRLATGDLARYGLPRPDHRILSVHPTISADLLGRVTHGDVTVKPALRELAGDRVRFVDGSEVEADVLVACTGYEPDFPFLSPDCVGGDPRRPLLFKRLFAPDIRSLAFIGLVQPLGPVMPIAELQGRLVADHLTGRYALPSPARMRAAIERDRRRHARRFPSDARHALEIDAEDYKRELLREHRRGIRRAARRGRRGTATREEAMAR
jgi:dimethylaniline monooxygenase (N-oxide forming)